MAAVTLSTDALLVAGTTSVNYEYPLFVPAGATANTYTLPGIGVSNERLPGSIPNGYHFSVVNESSNTQTFAAPSGTGQPTLVGTSSIATGGTTPTRVTFFYSSVSNRWIGF